FAVGEMRGRPPVDRRRQGHWRCDARHASPVTPFFVSLRVLYVPFDALFSREVCSGARQADRVLVSHTVAKQGSPCLFFLKQPERLDGRISRMRQDWAWRNI